MSQIIDLRKINRETRNKEIEPSTRLSPEKLRDDGDEQLEIETLIPRVKPEEPILGLERRESKEKENGGFWGFLAELAKVVVISLAIVLPVRYFLIQPFYVKGASMEPSFYDHEYLIINEIGYRLGEPGRGDIVVFRYPRQPDQFFIKRIIGLPGERVAIDNGQVIIYNQDNRDGKVLDESVYLLSNEQTIGSVDITLNEDEFYVLGDNREHSLDSRSFGPVSRKNIIGRTWIRGWPIDRAKKFGRPEYNL